MTGGGRGDRSGHNVSTAGPETETESDGTVEFVVGEWDSRRMMGMGLMQGSRGLKPVEKTLTETRMWALLSAVT